MSRGKIKKKERKEIVEKIFWFALSHIYVNLSAFHADLKGKKLSMEYDTNTANICTDLGICHGHANRPYFRPVPRIIFVNCHRSANLINLCSRTIFCSSYSRLDKAGQTFPEKYEIRLTWNITWTILSKCWKSNIILFRERNHLHNVSFSTVQN